MFDLGFSAKPGECYTYEAVQRAFDKIQLNIDKELAAKDRALEIKAKEIARLKAITNAKPRIIYRKR